MELTGTDTTLTDTELMIIDEALSIAADEHKDGEDDFIRECRRISTKINKALNAARGAQS